jgi:hypothetical protein
MHLQEVFDMAREWNLFEGAGTWLLECFFGCRVAAR